MSNIAAVASNTSTMTKVVSKNVINFNSEERKGGNGAPLIDGPHETFFKQTGAFGQEH